MIRIVIVGGSFGGLTTALQLKRRLKKSYNITVISADDKFVFVPSLPWLAIGWRKPRDITIDLESFLSARDIYFVNDTIRQIEPEQQRVVAGREYIPYDYLVLATGQHLDFEAIPGLGPEKGCTQSIFTLEHACQAYETWQQFLQQGGPVVAGATQGVSCFGPAYEFIFEIDHLLRKMNLRSKIPLYFVTSEPYLGHLGLGGVGKSRRLMEDEFAEKDIKAFCNAAVEEITPGQVKLQDGNELPFAYSMFAPPFRGVDAVLNSGLGNSKGWLMVDEYYRLPEHKNIFGVGVAVDLKPVDPTPVPTGVPKTGNMTTHMANMTAYNIAADIQGGAKVSLPVQEIGVTCLADMGDTASLMVAKPALPPRQKTVLRKKRWVRWAKLGFEKYYMGKLKYGISSLPG